MIAIIDCGVGNINAIANMLKKTGRDNLITNDVGEIERASKLILPGVGAFDVVMNELKSLNLLQVLDYKALQQKVPVLGICLGMQLLTNGSEEGQCKGLGWIPAYCYKFSPSAGIKIPQMQWNHVVPTRQSPLTSGLDNHSKFYFVHSYYVKTESDQYSILHAEYGVQFDAAIQKENIYGVQFHPEKSHKYGMRLLSNFSSL